MSEATASTSGAIAAAALAQAERGPGDGSPSGRPSVTDVIAQIVRALRDQPGRKGYTFDELGLITGTSVGDDTDLIISIERNPRLSLDRDACRVTYSSAHSIQSRAELLQFLKSRGRAQADGAGAGADFLPGFPVSELADAYAHAEAE